MQKLFINSFFHYQIIERNGKNVLIQFGDLCPKMGHRKEYDVSEGVECGAWSKDEFVSFNYDLSNATHLSEEERADNHIAEANPGPTRGIECGDDFRYHIQDADPLFHKFNKQMKDNKKRAAALFNQLGKDVKSIVWFIKVDNDAEFLDEVIRIENHRTLKPRKTLIAACEKQLTKLEQK